MAIGMAHLKKGDFVKAEDAFTLAAQYEAEHPRALAGRFMALLAQGEYMGSALFLGRVLEDLPVYAEYPSILPLILGADEVKMHGRALQDLIGTIPTPELLFLAGYLCYQLGDLPLAHQYLSTARASGTDVPGLAVLLPVVKSRLSR
jgi:tetratricopeptide (TPR) repeat protein